MLHFVPPHAILCYFNAILARLSLGFLLASFCHFPSVPPRFITKKGQARSPPHREKKSMFHDCQNSAVFPAFFPCFVCSSNTSFVSRAISLCCRSIIRSSASMVLGSFTISVFLSPTIEYLVSMCLCGKHYAFSYRSISLLTCMGLNSFPLRVTKPFSLRCAAFSASVPDMNCIAA